MTTRSENISRSMAARYQDPAFAAIHVPRVREHLKNQKADHVFAEHQSEASSVHMTLLNHIRWHVARNKWSRKCVLCAPVTV
jgi:hypothetical protein